MGNITHINKIESTMAELKWKAAILKVLEQEQKTMHYTEIAESIAKRSIGRH